MKCLAHLPLTDLLHVSLVCEGLNSGAMWRAAYRLRWGDGSKESNASSAAKFAYVQVQQRCLTQSLTVPG